MQRSTFRLALLGATAIIGLTLGSAPTSQAHVVEAGNGFQQGTTPGASLRIYKLEFNGSQEISGTFAGGKSGREFTVSIDNTSNLLGMTYTRGSQGPEIHYFPIERANGFVFFYDVSAPITSFPIDLDTDFRNSGFSDLTRFETAWTTSQILEPATLGILAAGLLGLGLVLRRRRH